MAWLTLFAFGVQLVVAAAHHHPSPRPGDLASRAITAGYCDQSGVGCKPDPCQQNSHGCALCWATAAAGHSVLPPATGAPVAPSQIDGRMSVASNDCAEVAHRNFFQARGPPAFV
ncbi:hypothetical protein DLM45_11130 [Hyphomicrobium methylovorum]|nr:hypothetical protein [Hyphomicrobium methylovorum]